MLAVTANIKSNPLMRQSRVDSDMDTVRTKGNVIFWQEIAPSRYKAALARVSALTRKRVAGIGTECPISYDQDRWAPLADPEVRVMHKGKAATSPTRYTVVQKVRRLRPGQHPKVAFMSSHYVSGGWSRRLIHFRSWRKQMWAVHFEKMRSWIEELHAQGFTVVLGADFNRTVATMPTFHRDQQIVAAYGIDGIIVIPAKGVDIANLRTPEIVQGLNTDHAPVVVGFTLHFA